VRDREHAADHVMQRDDPDAAVPEPAGAAEAVEASALRKLGVNGWDRPAIYRESAEAATDNRLLYWAVLLLSGAIATLGLALNSAAVVIGAMLVAPLLAPVLGLALALAVGDGRLAVQTAAIVLVSTIGVILVAAALTALLPFHTVTLEISARTRPTTLDLAIAAFSGLVGAVVTVSRRSRLSAAIPGVAIAVALIPPLAVAGFGVGVGRGDLLRGSLLLYAANLAGIVLSGMSVFLVIGMHRPEVLRAARAWHDEARLHGIAAWTYRIAWLRSLGVFQSPWARVGLVLAFVIALGLPLSETLTQIARETRVERAIVESERAVFDLPGRASILGRQVVFRADHIQVYLRVATTEWFGSAAREEFERAASAGAREPVRLTLEQLPARGEDIDQLRNLFPGQEAGSAPAAPVTLDELLVSARARLAQAVDGVVLPDDVGLLQTEVAVTDAGRIGISATYASPEPLGPHAVAMLRGQLERRLGLPDFALRLDHISLLPRPLDPGANDPDLADVIELLGTHERLHVEIMAAGGANAQGVRATIGRLASAGIDSTRITAAGTTHAGTYARLHVVRPE
jgi:uncharacterized hydrophobic protein (TIGR00271 family)